MNFKVREYTAADKHACVTAFKSNIPKYFGENEVEQFESFLDDYSAGKLEVERTKYYVLVLDDKIIGCGGFGNKLGSKVICFAWGLLHNNYHKQGFGEKLLEFRIQEIRKLYPSESIYLDTTQFTYQFFAKYGFSLIDITDNYFSEGLHKYAMVLAPQS